MNMDILKYVMEEILPLSVALNIIGFLILKPSLLIKDKFIPLFLMGLGIAGAFGLLSLDGKVAISTAIVQGVLATGLAVASHQVVKQTVKKD